MKREPGAILSTVFVDYDNIYLSLKRKNEEAAKRFAKDAPLWLGELMSGRLITPTNGPAPDLQRRIVMNRCYGNPVPRRNSNDNSTDMNSFPFVRHHFLRAGFEVIDCPPLTAQLKNSSDIRMVMDVRDYLSHDTYFEEFIILSGDADFTPLLHRLRAHARRTVIFANDYTAAPYTAISDGEVRESDLIALLLEGRARTQAEENAAITAQPALPAAAELEQTRGEIIKEVVTAVRSAGQPVPLEALADRAVRTLGHDRTVGTAWGGIGSFRDLLLKGLPEGVRLNEQPPYFVSDASRQIAHNAEPEPATEEPAAPTPRAAPASEARIEPRLEAPAPRTEAREPFFAAPQAVRRDERTEPDLDAPAAQPRERTSQQPLAIAPLSLPERHTQAATYVTPPQPEPRQPQTPAPEQEAAAPARPQQHTAPRQTSPQQQPSPQPSQRMPTSEATPAPAPAHARDNDSGATAIQRSIARIHEACQAPPLSPPEYRTLFDVMAQEITQNGLNGQQTLTSIGQRALDQGIETRRDDIRFILDVVSETDPWFDQGASAKLFAGRFRNFVVARCRSQGLTLSADELDLIDAWFAGPAAPQQRAPARTQQPRQAYQQTQATGTDSPAPAGDRWTGTTEQPAATQPERFAQPGDDLGGEDFPRIVRRGNLVR
jgi:NYN domain